MFFGIVSDSIRRGKRFLFQKRRIMQLPNHDNTKRRRDSDGSRKRTHERRCRRPAGGAASADVKTTGGKGRKGCRSVSMPEIDASSGMQLSFFQLDDPILSQIRDEILNLDINNLSPLQALNKLSDIRSILTGK